MPHKIIRTSGCFAPIILAGCVASTAQLSDLVFSEGREVYVLQQVHRLETSAPFVDSELEFVTSDGEFAGVYDAVFEGIREAFGRSRVKMLGTTKGPQDIQVWAAVGSLDLEPYIGAILVAVSVVGNYAEDLEARRYRLELSSRLQFAEVIDGRFRVYPKAIGSRPTGLGKVNGPLIPASAGLGLAAFKEAYPITNLEAALADSTRVAMAKWLAEFQAGPEGN